MLSLTYEDRKGGLVLRESDIIIVGAGTAGLTAAMYGARAGMKVLVIEEAMPGGQIIATSQVDNYPGLYQIAGTEYAMRLDEQAQALGAEIIYDTVVSAKLDGKIKEVTGETDVYQGSAVIVANGLKHRHLGCPGEEEFSGAGVSYCATCDGAMYRNKEVALVGGGNTALEDALFLADLCSKVYLIHRRDQFRGQQQTVAMVEKKENIHILYSSQVTAITGTNKVEAIEVTNKETGATEQLAVSGIFVAVGFEPPKAFYGDQIQVAPEGYIMAGEDCHTNVPGVYAAGDIRTKIWRQLVTAAGDGAVAGSEAADYIRKNR